MDYAHCEMIRHESSYPYPTWIAWYERWPAEGGWLTRLAKVIPLRNLVNLPDYYGSVPTENNELIYTATIKR